MTTPPVAGGRPHPRVALDAMGGDHAPAATVAGALLVRDDDLEVVLVGDAERLRSQLEEAGAAGAFEIVHAGEVVGMDEDPALALRGKRDASIRVAAALVADGKADALLSAGSTGATLAAGLLAIGRLDGVRRPAVAAVLPTRGGPTVLLDAGASPDVQPEALVAYAVMGAAFAGVRGVGAPRIGLLNVGGEPGKGNALAKAAYSALEAVEGFIGNVEPDAVLAGEVDVVVTDGFTGNVFLKTLEAAGAAAEEGTGPGAAVLLGCARPVLVAHGAADAREVAAALRTAAGVVAAGLTERIAEQLVATGTREEASDDG
jgi:glycerol-3-phosphate acyltransferase PlsX